MQADRQIGEGQGAGLIQVLLAPQWVNEDLGWQVALFF